MKKGKKGIPDYNQPHPEYARLQKQADREMAQVGTGKEYDEYMRSVRGIKAKRTPTAVDRYVTEMRNPQVRRMQEDQARVNAAASSFMDENAMWQKYGKMGMSPEEIRGMIARYRRENRRSMFA